MVLTESAMPGSWRKFRSSAVPPTSGSCAAMATANRSPKRCTKALHAMPLAPTASRSRARDDDDSVQPRKLGAESLTSDIYKMGCSENQEPCSAGSCRAPDVDHEQKLRVLRLKKGPPNHHADELAAALSDSTVFWGFAECLDCGKPVDFQVLARSSLCAEKTFGSVSQCDP